MIIGWKPARSSDPVDVFTQSLRSPEIASMVMPC
jgi:hypothetical protein